MNRTERLYAIVEALRAAGPAGRTSRQLAEQLEVSVRTIKRDMAGLAEAGVPLQAEEGRGGGYALARQAALPPLSFTPGEATAIAVALAADRELPFLREGRTALDKVLSAMTREQRDEAKDIARRVWTLVPPTLGPSTARVLDEAFRHRVVVVLDYVDGQGALTRGRPVEPMAFARAAGHWHLLAWCRFRHAGRWFRLDRVRGARLTRERAPERDLGEVFGEPPREAQPVRLR